MKTDKLIKQLELLSDSCESNYALEVNGYTQGVKDSIDIIKNSSLTEVGNRRELLKAFKEWERWDYKKTYDTPTDEIVSDYLSL